MAKDYQAFDHGYATTIHKAQGATVDRSFVMASATMDRHLTYVAMTRHRHQARLYAVRDEFEDMKALSHDQRPAFLRQMENTTEGWQAPQEVNAITDALAKRFGTADLRNEDLNKLRVADAPGGAGRKAEAHARPDAGTRMRS